MQANGTKTYYKSLADLWSTFNNDYFQADFPRLFVRAEDIIFYSKETITQIAECAGMKVRDNFVYMTARAKPRSATNWVGGMMKYGSAMGRFPSSVTPEERDYLQTALDPHLMKLFHYSQWPMHNNKQEVEGKL